VGEWLLIYTHTTSRALLVQTYTYTHARAHTTPSEPILNDDGTTHSVRGTSTKKDYLEAFLSFSLRSFFPSIRRSACSNKSQASSQLNLWQRIKWKPTTVDCAIIKLFFFSLSPFPIGYNSLTSHHIGVDCFLPRHDTNVVPNPI